MTKDGYAQEFLVSPALNNDPKGVSFSPKTTDGSKPCYLVAHSSMVIYCLDISSYKG